MGQLTREAILGVTHDLAREEVRVPEWGGTVFVRELTAKEMDAYQESVMDRRGKGDPKVTLMGARARLVVRCVFDGDGNRVFADGDVDALNNGPNTPIQRLFNVATRLNHLTAKDVEELAKNSDSAPPDSPPSD